MITVTLTWTEMLIGSTIGCVRQVKVLEKHIDGYNNQPADNVWHEATMGALGEIAVAKHFNLYWSGAAFLNAIDVGNMLEVRTCRKSHYQLILHKKDRDLPTVLVHPDPPRFHLLGWLHAQDGKLEKYWLDPKGGRPAFFVPQQDLLPIETLRVTIVLDVGEAALETAE